MKNFSRTPGCVLYVCCGSKCKSKGSKHLLKQLKSDVKHRHLKKAIEVIKTGCTDRCKAGPILTVMPLNEWHLQVDETSAATILENAIQRIRGNTSIINE